MEHAEAGGAALQVCSAYPGAAPHCLSLRLTLREPIAWLEAAVRAARDMGDRRVQGNHLSSLGGAYAAPGEAWEAVRYHQKALEIAREPDDERMAEDALGNLGSAHAALGEVQEAVYYQEQALEIAQEIGDRKTEGTRLGNLGLAYADLGEVQEAITYHEQGLDGPSSQILSLLSAFRPITTSSRPAEKNRLKWGSVVQ